MDTRSRLGWIGCVLVMAACERTLSVGELRCEGTTCEIPVYSRVSFDLRPAKLPPRETAVPTVALAWRHQLANCVSSPCGGLTPQLRAAHWVVQGDGSVTVARPLFELIDDDSETSTVDRVGQRVTGKVGKLSSLRRGIRLTQLDAGGEVRWDKELFVQEVSADKQDELRELTFHLARDTDDQLWLAVWRSGNADGSGLSIHRIRGEAEFERVLHDSEGCQPDDLVHNGGEFLVAGYYDGNPELSKYDAHGKRLYRQSVLLERHSLGPFYSDMTSGAGMQLAITATGKTYVAVPERAFGYQVSELDARGHIQWHAVLQAHTDDFHAKLVVDSQDRPVFGFDAYSVWRCRNADNCSDGDSDNAIRMRRAYYDPSLFGLTVDDHDRVYVLTQDGLRESRHMVIDRLTGDLSQVESFALDESIPAISETASNEDWWYPPREIALGPNGDLYYWSEDEIGRIRLPHD